MSNIVNNVVVSGEGFHFSVGIPSLSGAKQLIEQLYGLLKAGSTEPFPFFDGDDHLSGFVVPSLIRSVMLQPTQHFPSGDPLTVLHRDLMQAQLDFYRSHSAKGK